MTTLKIDTKVCRRIAKSGGSAMLLDRIARAAHTGIETFSSAPLAIYSNGVFHVFWTLYYNEGEVLVDVDGIRHAYDNVDYPVTLGLIACLIDVGIITVTP